MLDAPYQSSVDALLKGDLDEFTRLQEAAAMTEAGRDMLRRQAIAKVVQDCFGTPAGRRCLDWLIGQTLLQGESVQQITATTAEAYAIAAARMEGQKMLVATIIDALQFGRVTSTETIDDNA